MRPFISFICRGVIIPSLLAGSVLVHAEGVVSSATAVLRKISPSAVPSAAAKETKFPEEGPAPAMIFTKFEFGAQGEGYLMRDSGTGELIEFAIPDSRPVTAARILADVPNIWQFPVPGGSAPKVCSGCVPSAGANLVAYWAAHGFPSWATLRHAEAPTEEEIRIIVRRLRAKLSMTELSDDKGYTDERIPLSGASPSDLAQALKKDAKEAGVVAEVGCAAFSETAFMAEIDAGRPVLISCGVRIPHKPALYWGHEMTGIGYVVIDGVAFIGLRDNFLTMKGVKTRWLRADLAIDLITVIPRAK